MNVTSTDVADVGVNCMISVSRLCQTERKGELYLESSVNVYLSMT